MLNKPIHDCAGSLSPESRDGELFDRWYVLHAHAGSERLAEQHLRSQEFRTYLPMRQRTIRHARRVQTVLRPYFDCYLFVSFDVLRDRWSPINSTVGVRRLIMNGNLPVPVPDGVVQSLALATDEQGVLRPNTLLRPGQEVRIADGPFAGQLGMLQSVGSVGAVKVLLEIMNRAVSVQIRRENIIASL